MQQQQQLAEFFKEARLKEPSPRRQAGTLTTQMAGIRDFRFHEEQVRAVERALVKHAKRMAGEE
ncbi:MAG: hypothetical protein QXG57_06150 [Thermofilaceae archaeon]